MRCPSCGDQNADTSRFCGTCGGRLTARCPHCRAEVAPGQRFCNTCGGALPHASDDLRAGRDGADTPSSERRLVSVLFLDLEGFTALAEALDPEDVRNIQSRYFELARSVVLRYGGTLEKFIGDAVMAVWGAVAAHEDDAVRAARAALELVAGVGRLRGATPERRLSARAAVATGEAVVTLGAEGEGMVAGDLVNTAARLQTVAPTGGVLVDEVTHRLAGDAIEFEATEPQMLKGKTRTIATWRAVGAAEDRGAGRAAGHSGPFIGRSRELAELIDLQRRTSIDRRSRLVSVVGIAGIGKSRLIWEFERQLDALPDNVALHVGRAPSYGDGITFAPIAEMVRRRARISEGTPTEVARRQLGAALAELVPDEAERQWIEPRLASLLDPGADLTFEREELFAAWRRFFEQVADWTPALLVFEDLQWADPSLLDFIDHLMTWSRDHPIMVLTLARPELLDRRPGWGAEHRSFTAIHLERLPEPAMSELLAGLAPGLPDPVLRHILDRAGGVPLYAVDVVRMLIDRQLVRRLDGRFELTDPAAPLEIPESLHALVSARIDTLSPDERSMLLSASVLGRRFHPDALIALSGLSATDARVRIGALSRRELLAVDDELRSPGRGQLSFVQEAVREVAYRTLSRRERRILHLAAADHLESRNEPELVEAAAEHLVAAHRAAPDHPDAAAVALRAVLALRRAASRALALHVPARALTHLERALDLASGPETRAELWQEAAAAARSAGRFDEAERYLRESIAWTTERGEKVQSIRARAQLASLLLATERHASAIGDLTTALSEIPDLESDPAGLELAGQLARARVLVGDDVEGLEWAGRTLIGAKRLGLEGVAIDALITQGTARTRLGDVDAGLEDLNTAIADAQRAELVGVELRARNNLAWLVVTDDPHRSLEAARDGMAVATRMGIEDMALQLAEVATAVAVDTGDWDWAVAALDETRDRPQAPAHRIQFACTRATLLGLRGETGADEVLRELEPLGPETDPQIVAGVDMARAWIALVDGRLAEARERATAAAAHALGAEQHAALVLATRAALWQDDRAGVAGGLAALTATGQRGRAVAAAETTLRAGAAALDGSDRAPALYEEAIGAWRDLRLPLHLALCLTERDRHLGGGATGKEATAILEAMGARGLLAAARSPALT